MNQGMSAHKRRYTYVAVIAIAVVILVYALRPVKPKFTGKFAAEGIYFNGLHPKVLGEFGTVSDDALLAFTAERGRISSQYLVGFIRKQPQEFTLTLQSGTMLRFRFSGMERCDSGEGDTTICVAGLKLVSGKKPTENGKGILDANSTVSASNDSFVGKRVQIIVSQ